MNKRQILAALALAFALGLAAPVAIYADEVTSEQSSEEATGENTNEEITITDEESTTPTEENDEEISAPTVSEEIPATQATNAVVTISTDDVAALKDALENIDNSEVVLNSDITVSSATDLDITRSDNSEVTLNLNGHKITTANNIRMISLRKGHLHIKGGTLESTFATVNSKPVLAVYGSATPVTIDSSNDYYTFVMIDNDVTIKSNGYGISVYDEAADGSHTNAAYGICMEMNGQIVAPYGIAVSGNITQGDVNGEAGSRAPVISLGNGSSITSTLKDANGKINGGAAIYAAGNAQWSIDGSTIESGTGIEAKAGIFYITNAKIKASGPASQGTPQMGLAVDTGAVFQIEANSQYNGANPVAFHINSGEFSSENNSVFYQYGDDDNKFDQIEVLSGSFTPGAGKPVFAGVGSDKAGIYGGNYYGAMGLGENSLPENFEYVTETDANGNTYTKVVPISKPGQGAGGDETKDDVAGADEEVPDTGAFSGEAAKASNLTTSVIPMLASVVLASGIAFVASKRLRRAGDKKN